jgi:hypothetical protein
MWKIAVSAVFEAIALKKDCRASSKDVADTSTVMVTPYSVSSAEMSESGQADIGTLRPPSHHLHRAGGCRS